MAEYRTFFIGAKLLANILLPMPFLRIDILSLALYAFSIVFMLVVLVCIFYKKRLYFKKYLCREYVPGRKLILFIGTVDTAIMASTYVALFKHNNNTMTTTAIIVMIAHFITAIVIFLILLFQKAKNKAVIAYTRHEYKLGIVARDLGGEKGLKKGQPVEIVQETPGGYIVKDSHRYDYQIAREDIESIIDVV